MVKIELQTNTLAVLVAGLYCTAHSVDAIAIPESIYLSIAEKLEHYINNGLWDFNNISFEEWVNSRLLIYPQPLFTDDELKDLKANTLYWEVPNGNTILSVSMDIMEINNE